MKVIVAAFLTLLSSSTASWESSSTSESGWQWVSSSSSSTTSKSGKSRGEWGGQWGGNSNGGCSYEKLVGLWQYAAQNTGIPWNAYLACTKGKNLGQPGVDILCQMTDQPQWIGTDYVTIAYFTPDYVSINEDGYCSVGYNEKGLPVFLPTAPPASEYPKSIQDGLYRFKGQLVGNTFELLFTNDGGETFYNEDNVRLALNAAA